MFEQLILNRNNFNTILSVVRGCCIVCLLFICTLIALIMCACVCLLHSIEFHGNSTVRVCVCVCVIFDDIYHNGTVVK